MSRVKGNVIAEYDESSTLSRTYVHGTQYIDERAVMRDHTEDPVADDGSTGQDHYYLLKDLYTVVGLAGANGELEEAYVYDTYGHPGHQDHNGHGYPSL